MGELKEMHREWVEDGAEELQAAKEGDESINLVCAEVEEETEQVLPWGVMILLYAITVFDVSVLMITMPIIPEFARDVLGLSGVKLGTVVGSVSSAYYCANALSSAWIGHISDIHGRRPVILFGMLISICTVIIFPLSTTVTMVVVNRFVCGFFNSNLTMSKAAMADISNRWPTDKRNLTFGYLGASWGLARFFSSAFAGLTTGIKLPFLPFVRDNPYFFPCFGLSVLSLFVFGFALVYLPETRPAENSVVETESSESSLAKDAMKQSMFRQLRVLHDVGGMVLIKLLFMHLWHQFLNGGITTAFVLLLALEESKGGFGFAANDVGLVFAFYGISGLMFQLFFYGKLVKKYGMRRVYSGGVATLAVGSVLFSASVKLTSLTEEGKTRLVLVMLSTMPVAVGFMCGLPVLIALMANASPPRMMGLSQGTAQSTGSFFRMLGPLAFGALFSYTVQSYGSYLAFSILALSYLVLATAGYYLPESVETPLSVSLDTLSH